MDNIILACVLAVLGVLAYLCNYIKVDKIDLYGIYNYFSTLKQISITNHFWLKTACIFMPFWVSAGHNTYLVTKIKSKELYIFCEEKYSNACDRNAFSKALKNNVSKTIEHLNAKKTARILKIEEQGLEYLKLDFVGKKRQIDLQFKAIIGLSGSLLIVLALTFLRYIAWI